MLKMDNIKAVVTGATGWLGRSCIRAFSSLYEDLDLQLYSGRARRYRLSNGITYTSQSEESLSNSRSKVNFFVPLSFLTHDNFLLLGKAEYERQNRIIIERALDWMRLNRPRNTILISSGIVSNLDESTNLADGYKSYASLKLYQEQQFKTLAHEEGLSLAVVRAYSLSGSEMCYPEKYALGSFIMSALKKEPIKISSSTPTYRGYCDAESIFLTAAKTLENQKNIEFDSFGPIVEMRELAQEVNKVLENKKPIVDDALPMRPGDRNNYYSTDTTMMHLMESLSIARLELRDQIKLTASGLLCSLDGR